ncbi:hypothetical protein CLU79DRAFT_700797 [Phycomyces nitens]|nr:hypothetical protein CLU79DRAFT_700797 [Phycomyces nitens]
MAKAYPDSTFIGADIADVFPKDDLPPNVSFSIIDISKPLPFEENSFDLINSRLIIISIQEDRWPTMLKEWHRMVKPGGLVQLMEYDHLVSVDFFVSNKLPALLRCSGFDVLEKDSRNIELKADGTELSKRIVENWIRAMLGFKPFILPFICPENPDLYDSLLEENVNACIEQGWFKRAIGVVGRKPLV